MATKILIVGAGAIGAFYGALLAKQGAEVTVVCRSDYERVKQQGFVIKSETLGEWSFQPSAVLQNSKQYKGLPDYVFVCTKVIESIKRPDLIRPVIGKSTAIVLIQNGVDIEREINQAFPDNELISGLAFICANKNRPGIVDHLAYGKLTLGNIPTGHSDKTKKLCELFNISGVECQTSDDIVADRWQKCIWNAPFNPLSVISGGLSTLEILQSQELFIRQIMLEVFTVATRKGHHLPDDIIETNIENTYNMPPYKTSMLLDFEAGRPLEVEAILGNAIKASQSLKIETPRLQSLYALLKLKELSRSTSPRIS